MDACSLCCDESGAWAVGHCEHATCLVCSVRLRALCEQRDCPVCREKLNKVIVSDSAQSFALPPHGSKVDRKYGYIFHTTKLYDQYKSIQACRCSKCHDKPTFGSFAQLRDHMRKTHGLVYCDICCENLKLFPFEFRQYSRQELTRHRREGDPEDTSYKGHPLCQFCDDRFFDNDALHTHLRKVHFWCHFCESDGKQDYYSTYPLLRNHFREEHYLCTEGACQQEKFTSVFRSKLDLQVHRAKVHSRGATKAVAKQMRQLDVEFMYGRAEDRGGGGGGGAFSASSSGVGRGGQWQSVQQHGRHNKTRDKDKATSGPPTPAASVQSRSQQRDSKSPPNTAGNWRKLKTSTASSGGQYMSEQPPRMKHKQQQQLQPTTATTPSPETLPHKVGGNPTDSKAASVATKLKTTTEAVTSQAKKPPGFETSKPAKNPTTMNTDSASEWPDLLSLNISSSPAAVEELKQASAPKTQTPPPPYVRYNPLEPSNFPPLGFPLLSSTSTNNNYSTTVPPVERRKASLSAAVASSIPPGFVTPQWQLIQQDPIYKSPSSSSSTNLQVRQGTKGSGALQHRVTEGSVVSMVREALDNDRERFNHFRNLSGWYRNSEITVQEYVLRCRELFGGYKWMMIGEKLAQVMPIECKRNELLQNVYAGMKQLRSPAASPSEYLNQLPPQLLPMQGSTGSTSTSAPVHVSRSESQTSRAAKWGILTSRDIPNWESESDYPTLHPGGTSTRVRGQVQPPGLSGHYWIKPRVPPV